MGKKSLLKLILMGIAIRPSSGSPGYIQNYYQAEQDYRKASYAAVGSLAAPFAAGALAEMGAGQVLLKGARGF